MCFKRMALSVSLLVLAACGLHVGEKAPPVKDITVPSGQFACVGEIGKKAELYVNASMSDAEINSFVLCLQKAFRSFNEKMRGIQVRDTFTPAEIRDFIQKLLPKSSPEITDELLHQFMLIKHNLVGGPIDLITREDLEAAIDILEQIRREAVRLRPFIPILNPRLVEKEKDLATLGDRIIKAENAAFITGQVFGRILSKSQKPYSFRDFEKWLTEFRQFLKWEEHFPGGHSAHEWIRLIAAFKSVAVSSGNDQMVGGDWGPLFQSGVQWYLSYIKFDVGIKKQTEIFDGVGLQNMISWGDSVFVMLERAVSRHNGLIEYEALDELLTALKGVGWLPTKIEAESLQSAMRLFANRILGLPSMNSCVRSSPGITSFTISSLKTEFDQWKELQLALEEKFAERRKEKLRSSEGKLPALNVVRATLDDDQHKRAVYDRLIDSFKGRQALFLDGEPRVHIASASSKKTEDSFYNLSKLNMFRAIMTLIFKGYATQTSGDIMQATLSSDQLQTIYLDFRSLGIDLGYIDRRVPNAGRRTFLEAKLFTPDADGVSAAHPNITFMQAVQEAAYLYSGGDLATEMYNRLKKLCAEKVLGGTEQEIVKDINDEQMIDRQCVRENLTDVLVSSIVSEVGESVSSMPGLLNFLNGVKDKDRRLLYSDTLLKAAFSKRNLRLDPNLEFYVEKAELSTVAVVVQYAESVLTRYDVLPENETLSEKEVNMALPVFEGLALSTIPKPNWFPDWIPLNGLAEHGFKFVLKYGRSPESVEDFASIMAHWTGKYDPPKKWEEIGRKPKGYFTQWHLNVDRQGLTEVFASLIQKISDSTSSPSQNARPPCK